MSKLVFIIFFVLIAMFSYKKMKTSQLTTVSTLGIKTTLSDYKVDQTKQIDQCLSKNYCVYIYVAPWCPACHQLLEKYNFIKEKLNQKNIGTLIIVGADENRSKEVALKEEWGENAILDSVRGDFRIQNKIDSFPFVIVVEPNNKVVAYGSSAFDFINRQMNN